MRASPLLTLLSLALASACASNTREVQSVFTDPGRSEHSGSGLGDSVVRVTGPKEDRCAQKPKSSNLRRSCDDALYLAHTYARQLSPGDSVCLQSGFGHEPTGACGARAKVRDVHEGEVLLEVLDVKPDSKWFDRQGHQFWFTEPALIDLYLDEQGY